MKDFFNERFKMLILFETFSNIILCYISILLIFKIRKTFSYYHTGSILYRALVVFIAAVNENVLIYFMDHRREENWNTILWEKHKCCHWSSPWNNSTFATTSWCKQSRGWAQVVIRSTFLYLILEKKKLIYSFWKIFKYSNSFAYANQLKDVSLPRKSFNFLIQSLESSG